MSIPNLPVNFKDDILATTNQKRKYNLIQNDDGTVSFEDATEYQQMGSDFGAGQINATNDAINKAYSERILDLDSLELVTEPGFFVDALAVKEAYSELNGNNEVKISHEYLVSQATLTKRGNVVTLTYAGDWDAGTPARDLGTLFTLPDGFAPPASCVAMTLPALRILITVRNTGKITAWNYDSALTEIETGRFTLTWNVSP